MLNEQIDSYGWVNDFEALTVAVVHGRSEDEVLRIYGADAGESNLIILRPEPGQAVIALENDGYTGGVPEIARRCSANGGRFFSVYWNVNAYGTVIEAVDGTVTAYFEHLYPLAPHAEAGEKRPSWAIGAEIGVDKAKAACFALMEQRTGVALDRRWLNDPRPVYAIPDPHWMLKGIEGVDRP